MRVKNANPPGKRTGGLAANRQPNRILGMKPRIVNRVVYRIELEALPGWGRPGIQRLRAALKMLLRGFGLRCVSLREGE